jgi:hypothetical protein
MIRLINPLKEWPVEIEETEILIRQMNWGDYLQMLNIAELLSDAFKNRKFDESIRVDFNRLLKKYIAGVDVKIDGVQLTVDDFVERLTFAPSQKIAEKLIAVSSMKEEDRKNSEDSSSSEK